MNLRNAKSIYRFSYHILIAGIILSVLQLINKRIYTKADTKGRFHLYSNTSKFATGSALYQLRMAIPSQ